VGFTDSRASETNDNIDGVMGGNDNGGTDDDDNEEEERDGMCHRTGISSLFFHKILKGSDVAYWNFF
jgi:hypothetical protein